MARLESEYNKKRNFDITPEPADEDVPSRKRGVHALQFVVQKHDARGLHYDFRIELDGTLKSWAVPKGPSLDPVHKRMAIPTEDHPLSYAKFEGHIPHGQYGGGDMIIWDQGIWKPHGDAAAAFKAGKLKFTLIGEKLSGDWALVRTRGRGDSDKAQWLLIKERDSVARPSAEYDILFERPESIITGDVLPGEQGTIAKSKVTSTTRNKTNTQLKKTSASIKKVATDTKAKSISIPESFSPQLATLVSEPPMGDWVYEIKFDGYRMLARVLKGKVSLFTRNGNDWTHRLPVQVKAIEGLKLKDSWLDGEMVVLNENGLPSFQALQNAFELNLSNDIIFYLFDAPYLNNEDLRELPMEERRKRLKKIIPRSSKSPLRYSGTFEADHRSIVQSACAMSLEGVIGKRVGSTYVSRRSDDWIKLKCRLRQEFVIVGYTDPQGSRSGFGAILLAVNKELHSPELIYAGRVGTGFDTKRLDDMHKKMKALEQAKSPVTTKLTGVQARGVHWIKPKLICEVEFAEWTGEGVLRQASFISLRTDKPAKDIIREQPKSVDQISSAPSSKDAKKSNEIPTTSTKAKGGQVEVANIPITHPERIIDAASGGTKFELAEFYNTISEFILPHLEDRPVSLLRAPDGIAGEQFFQKHAEGRGIPHIVHLDQKFDPDHAPLMAIDSVQCLIGCVQMNTIELHTWGSTTNNIEAPDRFVLDLDPDPALPWRSVVEATKLTLAVLDELKLTAFLKTSGGKGMHIIVPLTPDAGWDAVKQFAKSISEFMARQIPERFVAKMGPKNRIGKIFIDYLRNSRGASTVCAFSVRARPGLAVSVPIAREELDKIKIPDHWNIHNLHECFDKLKSNPWGNYSGTRYQKNQKITAAMWKKLGAKPAMK
ncbi:MAG: DNA ligase D [Cellvibrio sp.]|uniref:DNA ligase D n=1 Tax=Cellvibrio sp. TaxID=1965322 RepID=UPI0031AA21A8